MWYLIFVYDYNTYVHKHKTKEDALKEYEEYNHLAENECKISLAFGEVLNSGN